MKNLLLGFVVIFSFNAFAEGFHGNTLVSTPRGQLKLKDLKAGDEVFSYNENATCEARFDDISVKKIKGVLKVASDSMVEIKIAGDKIALDAETKVFSVLDKAWVNAAELKVGSIVMNAKFETLEVEGVKKSKRSSVYVVEVEDNHTLFVGKENILAHNGPLSAAACGIVCKIITTAGCGMGAFVIGVANPGLGILYGAVCAALDTAGAASCAVTCLALPIP